MTVPAKIAPTGDIMESVLLKGDIAKLSPDERVRYYSEVCRSMGLNPLTKPFEFITLNGKLQLYALRSCTDQLRKINSVTLEIVSREIADDILTFHVRAKLPDGRADEDLGAVSFPSTLKGEARANAELKAITKAKRRATLSICGLGWLDETEVEDIPAAAKRPAKPAPNVMLPLPPHDEVTGEVIEQSPPPDAATGAPSVSADPTGGAPTVTNETSKSDDGPGITEIDGDLAAAAEHGSLRLQQVWTGLKPAQQKMLKAALDRRHKPRALEVDAKTGALG